jgi:hypothetical protein
MKEQIVWIGGYPFVNGVNAPTGTQSDDPVEQKLLSDVEWEAEQKAKGITGWKLFQAFLKRMGEED